MVSDSAGEFVVETMWHADEGRCTIVVRNQTERSLRRHRVGLSGHARIARDARVESGVVVARLSNFTEIAAPGDDVLAPGGVWTINIDRLEFPIRHWTDGWNTAYLIGEDGEIIPARTVPVALAGRDEIRRRGRLSLPVETQPGGRHSIIPWPNALALSGRRTAPEGFDLVSTSPVGERAALAFAELTGILFAGEGMVRGADEGGLPVHLTTAQGLGDEGYRIDFTEERIEVAAECETGFLYGLVTLGQLQRGARIDREQLDFPATGRIEDAPRFGWRGSHLDVARRFYGVDEIRRFLAAMAWSKLNRFHWHLSDDEAWRVEIDAYPALVEIGAWRGHGLPLPPLLGSGPERSGGYYSKTQIGELVALAGRLGIEVIPEVDVPGHCYALLQALPELRDPGENSASHSIQSFPNNCLNPGIEAVYGAIETIFGEMLALFPGRWFHVGADEVPADAWHASVAANALRRDLGVDGALPLQAHFLKRVQAFLAANGKVTGAWEEAGEGGGIDKGSAYLVGWQKVESALHFAREGYDVVSAPAQAYYLDMALDTDWFECGAAWAGWSSVENSYAFEPGDGWSDEDAARLLGVQACIWSEPMADRAVFDRLVYPRLSAIAETGWTRKERKDFARFIGFAGLLPSLYGLGEDR